MVRAPKEASTRRFELTGARLRAEKLNIRCLFSPPQGIDDTPIVGLDERRASGGDEIMGYKPIESYGVIGDLHTVALVGIDGSIDWCCLPHFDSPSVFAAILDDQKGGRFRIAPAGDHFRRKQFYWPDTAILVTRFLHDDGVGEVEDYMPVGGTGAVPDELIRRVRVVRGRLPFHLECRPAFDYARAAHECHLGAHG